MRGRKLIALSFLLFICFTSAYAQHYSSSEDKYLISHLGNEIYVSDTLYKKDKNDVVFSKTSVTIEYQSRQCKYILKKDQKEILIDYTFTYVRSINVLDFSIKGVTKIKEWWLVKDANYEGILDENGDFVCPLQYEEIIHLKQLGIYDTKKNHQFYFATLFQLKSKNGITLYNPELMRESEVFDYLNTFYVDGDTRRQLDFQNKKPLQLEWFLVRNKKGWGAIDNYLNYTIPLQEFEIDRILCGTHKLFFKIYHQKDWNEKENGFEKYYQGLMDMNGKTVFQPNKYSQINPHCTDQLDCFNVSDYSIVYIDAKEKILYKGKMIPMVFIDSNEIYFWVSGKKGTWSIYNSKTKLIRKMPQWIEADEIRNLSTVKYHDQYIPHSKFVARDYYTTGLSGIVAFDGTTVIPFSYSHIEPFYGEKKMEYVFLDSSLNNMVYHKILLDKNLKTIYEYNDNEEVLLRYKEQWLAYNRKDSANHFLKVLNGAILLDSIGNISSIDGGWNVYDKGNFTFIFCERKGYIYLYTGNHFEKYSDQLKDSLKWEKNHSISIKNIQYFLNSKGKILLTGNWASYKINKSTFLYSDVFLGLMDENGQWKYTKEGNFYYGHLLKGMNVLELYSSNDTMGGYWNIANGKFDVEHPPYSLKFDNYSSNANIPSLKWEKQTLEIQDNNFIGKKNAEGKWLYRLKGVYFEGYRTLVLKDSSRIYFDPADGHIIFKSKFPFQQFTTADNKYYFSLHIKDEEDDHWYFVDQSGKTVLNIPLDLPLLRFGGYHTDYIVFKTNGKFGILNYNFKVVEPAEYSIIRYIPEHEFYLLRKNEKWQLKSFKHNITVNGTWDNYYLRPYSKVICMISSIENDRINDFIYLGKTQNDFLKKGKLIHHTTYFEARKNPPQAPAACTDCALMYLWIYLDVINAEANASIHPETMIGYKGDAIKSEFSYSTQGLTTDIFKPYYVEHTFDGIIEQVTISGSSPKENKYDTWFINKNQYTYLTIYDIISDKQGFEDYIYKRVLSSLEYKSCYEQNNNHDTRQQMIDGFLNALRLTKYGLETFDDYPSPLVRFKELYPFMNMKHPFVIEIKKLPYNNK